MTAAYADFVPEPEVRQGLPAVALLVHLRAMLRGDSGPKVFCNVELRGPKWRLAECRLDKGHPPGTGRYPGGHCDPCQGLRW